MEVWHCKFDLMTQPILRQAKTMVVQLNDVAFTLRQGMFNKDNSRIFVNCTVRDWSGHVDCALLTDAALVVFGVESEAIFRQRATASDFQPLSNTWNVRGAFSIAQSLEVSSMS